MQAFLTQARMQAPTDGTQGVQAATSYEDLARTRA